jgi:uncharacterized protein
VEDVAQPDDLKITNNTSAGRYEMSIDGEQVGFLEYTLSPPRIVLDYIEIDPARRGGGLGERFTVAVLEECRARGLKVTPRCSYIAGYLRANAEKYSDLLRPV